MKSLALILTLLVFALPVKADNLSDRLTPDILVGVSKIYEDETGVLKSDTFKDTGLGVLYELGKTPLEPGYTMALTGHIILGGLADNFQVGGAFGVSFFDGWLRIEPGLQFDGGGTSGFLLLGTSFGVQMPDF